MSSIIPYSKYNQLDENWQKECIRHKVIPIVDQFVKLSIEQPSRLILVGSYGSGKSFYVVDNFIDICLNSEYARIYYGRKVKDTVRNSLFTTIVEEIERYGLSDEFEYSKSANSSMKIVCKKNGNSFIPFGADKIDKLKSIKEPTAFILEELDQFTLDDWGMCLSRLNRTNKAKCQIWGMCNTDKIDESHWLYDIIFKKKTEIEMNGVVTKIADVHFSYFKNNYALPSIEDYDASLRVKSMGNEDIYNSIALALPAVVGSNNRWLYTLNDKDIQRKVFVEDLPYYPNLPLYLSFDFNNNPYSCLIRQMSMGNHMFANDPFIHDLQEIQIQLKGSANPFIEIASIVRNNYNIDSLPIFITGDASGWASKAGLVSGARNNYDLLQSAFKISDKQIKTPLSNPRHSASRNNCNAILYSHKNYKMNKNKCPQLYKDMLSAVASDKVGNGDEIVKDRGIHCNDMLDCWRYANWTFLEYFESK